MDKLSKYHREIRKVIYNFKLFHLDIDLSCTNSRQLFLQGRNKDEVKKFYVFFYLQAKATRDAMAKALYQNLFEWTVNSVNMALAQRTRDNKLRSQVSAS